MSYIPPSDHLTEMITAQLAFQQKLGHDFPNMTMEQRIRHVKEMYIAAVQELGEALDEVSWKSWATSERFDESPFVHELSDAFQFIMNLWFVALPHLSPAELAKTMHAILDEKLVRNHQRADIGYDGVSGKCPSCRRDLAEITVTEVHRLDGQKSYYCACDHPLDHELITPYLVG